MKILSKPAFSNKTQNPYNYLLYSNMRQEHDCTIDEFTPQKALFNRYDILHIHWPEVMLFESNARSLVTVIAFLFLIQWMRLRGTKLVWTVHDLRSHEFVYKGTLQRKIERWYFSKFTGLLDGIIALSHTSLDEAISCYPVLAEKKQFVIPHGHYKDIFPSRISREQAREKLGFGDEELVVSYFGQIRPYKNVPKLIQTFGELDNEKLTLMIAGRPASEELESDITRLANGLKKRVKLLLKFIPEDQVELIFKASDLVVIPYKDILNSGSVLLSLSFDVPVLVPEKGSITELKELFGRRWVKTYKDEFSAEVLTEAIQQIAEENHVQCQKINDFGWDRIAKDTFAAYNKLIIGN